MTDSPRGKKPKGVYLDSEGLNLSFLSTKYVEDKDLKDTPSRLFRRLLKESGITIDEIVVLINDHLQWDITEEDPVKAKNKRTNARGNIKANFFNSQTMTFPKLLEGLSMLKAKRVKFTLEVDFHNRPSVIVEETSKIYSSYKSEDDTENKK